MFSIQTAMDLGEWGHHALEMKGFQFERRELHLTQDIYLHKHALMSTFNIEEVMFLGDL